MNDGHTRFRDDSVTLTTKDKITLGGTYETVGTETAVRLNEVEESPTELSIDIVNKAGWAQTIVSNFPHLAPYFERETTTDTYSNGTHKPDHRE